MISVEILTNFESYKKQIGDDLVAAILTLAHEVSLLDLVAKKEVE